MQKINFSENRIFSSIELCCKFSDGQGFFFVRVWPPNLGGIFQVSKMSDYYELGELIWALLSTRLVYICSTKVILSKPCNNYQFDFSLSQWLIEKAHSRKDLSVFSFWWIASFFRCKQFTDKSLATHLNKLTFHVKLTGVSVKQGEDRLII